MHAQPLDVQEKHQKSVFTPRQSSFTPPLRTHGSSAAEAQCAPRVPAAIERYGACGSSLDGLVRMLCGDGDRDIVQCEGVVFSAVSRVTFFAQQIVFAAVIADAEMVLSFLEQDVHARDII